MMSKIKLLTIAVIGLFLLNAGIITFMFLRNPLRPDEGRPPVRKEAPRKAIVQMLHFDKEQADQYKELIDLHQALIRNLDDKIAETKNELYQTLSTENTAAKDSLLLTLANLQKQVESVHYGHFQDIKKICRPDQLPDFDKLTKELAGLFSRAARNNPPPPKD
jgi:dsDNA-binding SOS-regulon protein